MSEKEQCLKILEKLRSLSNPRAVEGMARFGINPKNTYGVSIPTLRNMAKEIHGNHVLPSSFGLQVFMKLAYWHA